MKTLIFIILSLFLLINSSFSKVTRNVPCESDQLECKKDDTDDDFICCPTDDPFCCHNNLLFLHEAKKELTWDELVGNNCFNAIKKFITFENIEAIRLGNKTSIEGLVDKAFNSDFFTYVLTHKYFHNDKESTQELVNYINLSCVKYFILNY